MSHKGFNSILFTQLHPLSRLTLAEIFNDFLISFGCDLLLNRTHPKCFLSTEKLSLGTCTYILLLSNFIRAPEEQETQGQKSPSPLQEVERKVACSIPRRVVSHL